MISAKEARTLSDYAIEKLTTNMLEHTEYKIKESIEQGNYSCVVTYDLGMNTKGIKEVLQEQGYNVKDSFSIYPSLYISWEW